MRRAAAGAALLVLGGMGAARAEPPCFEPNERSLGEYHVISADLRRIILDGINKAKDYAALQADDLALKTTVVDKDVMVFFFVRRPFQGRTPLCYRESVSVPLKRYLEIVGAAVAGTQ